MYDTNPVPYGDTLSLNVSETDNSISIDLALESAKYYELSNDGAIEISNSILSTVKENWEKLAVKYGISRNEIEYMRPAFYVASKS